MSLLDFANGKTQERGRTEREEKGEDGGAEDKNVTKAQITGWCCQSHAEGSSPKKHKFPRHRLKAPAGGFASDQMCELEAQTCVWEGTPPLHPTHTSLEPLKPLRPFSVSACSKYKETSPLGLTSMLR